jgi:folate-binding protein YgfZ
MLIEHYNAARNSAAVVRQSWMGLLKLAGPDRQSWLQGMVTNEVEKLAPGQGCYAGHLNPQGKLVAQMIVLVTEAETWLLVERTATAKLAAVFDKLIVMEDVQVHDASEEYDILAVIGPRATAVIEAWSGQAFPETPLYCSRFVPQGCVVSSDLGYDLIVPRDTASSVLENVVAAGAAQIDAESWNIVRTEAGLPLYGVDIDETTTLPELGGRGISYEKGCYIGQEVVARIKYIGHVNRRFVGFLCEGPDVPEIRSAVELQGKDVGYVTTAVFSPELAKPISLGFVNRVAGEPGTAVVFRGKGGAIPGRVVPLPFLPIRSGD